MFHIKRLELQINLLPLWVQRRESVFSIKLNVLCRTKEYKCMFKKMDLHLTHCTFSISMIFLFHIKNKFFKWKNVKRKYRGKEIDNHKCEKKSISCNETCYFWNHILTISQVNSVTQIDYTFHVKIMLFHIKNTCGDACFIWKMQFGMKNENATVWR